MFDRCLETCARFDFNATIKEAHFSLVQTKFTEGAIPATWITGFFFGVRTRL
jgi:hypothetical protein